MPSKLNKYDVNYGSAQDYRHQEDKWETNEGNERDTSGATETMIR